MTGLSSLPRRTPHPTLGISTPGCYEQRTTPADKYHRTKYLWVPNPASSPGKCESQLSSCHSTPQEAPDLPKSQGRDSRKRCKCGWAFGYVCPSSQGTTSSSAFPLLGSRCGRKSRECGTCQNQRSAKKGECVN